MPPGETFAEGPNATFSDREFYDPGELRAGDDRTEAGDYQGYGWGWEGSGYDLGAVRPGERTPREGGYYDEDFSDDEWREWFSS